MYESHPPNCSNNLHHGFDHEGTMRMSPSLVIMRGQGQTFPKGALRPVKRQAAPRWCDSAW
eukprot:2823700-Amphidinium_carterae.1